MHVVVARRGIDIPAASASRFETEVLTQGGNVEGLGRLNATSVDRAMTNTAHRRVILVMVLSSRLGCPLSLKTDYMGNPRSNAYPAPNSGLVCQGERDRPGLANWPPCVVWERSVSGGVVLRLAGG